MANSQPKSGRSRRYALEPAAAFANREAAYFVAALDELAQRLFDLIEDLPHPLLDFVPQNGANSIAKLTLHMADAEANWIARISGTTSSELTADLQHGQQTVPCPYESTELIKLCQRVREEILKPAVTNLVNIDAQVVNHEKVTSVRELLLHQIWHWTYHTGQVGLLRRLSKTRYQWNF
jgi:uncharacterized damage-inducible protein DinB